LVGVCILEIPLGQGLFDFICQDLLGKMMMGMYCDEKDGHDLECATVGRREDEILYIMDVRVVFVKMGS